MTSTLNSTPTANPPSVPNKFFLHIDDEWAVTLSNDHNNNLCVMVLNAIETSQKNADGTAQFMGKQWSRIWMKLVPSGKDVGGNESPVDPMDFKRAADLAISQAKQHIETQKMKRERIVGTMVNYWPQAQKFNAQSE